MWSLYTVYGHDRPQQPYRHQLMSLGNPFSRTASWASALCSLDGYVNELIRSGEHWEGNPSLKTVRLLRQRLKDPYSLVGPGTKSKKVRKLISATLREPMSVYIRPVLALLQPWNLNHLKTTYKVLHLAYWRSKHVGINVWKHHGGIQRPV